MSQLKLEGEPFVNEYNSAEVIAFISYQHPPRKFSSQAPDPATEAFKTFLENNLLPILKATKPAICHDPEIILHDNTSLYAVSYRHYDSAKSLNKDDIKKKIQDSINIYNKQIAEKERSTTLFSKAPMKPAEKADSRQTRACRK